MTSQAPDEIRAQVARFYASRIAGVGADEAEPIPLAGSSCCGPTCCGGETATDAGPSNAGGLYAGADVADLPSSVTGVAFGCGNPTAIHTLQPGDVVLDLGSGGGIDCFLAAKAVGPAGFVYGVDMTPEMVRLARANAAKVGATNVEFRLGEIEQLPITDASIDVVISNCVINLSPDKDRVFREAFRVLRPGGRLQVSDIVWTRPMPDAVKDDAAAWAGCIGGALIEADYLAHIRAAGFDRLTRTTAEYPDSGGLASISIFATKA